MIEEVVVLEALEHILGVGVAFPGHNNHFVLAAVLLRQQVGQVLLQLGGFLVGREHNADAGKGGFRGGVLSVFGWLAFD